MTNSRKRSWIPQTIKQGLAPLWYRNQVWQDDLAKKASYQAADIPDDDVEIHNTKSGIGALGAMGIAAAAGLAPVLAIWGMNGLPGLPKGATPTVPSVVATSPVQVPVQLDSEWDVETLKSDEKGNIIQPEQVINRTRYRSRSGIVEKRMPDGTWERVK